MSLKTYDTKGRWRNKTVGFRMSLEEAEQLDTMVKLSGLTKQDYLICRALEKDVIVQGNPRVYKQLRNQLVDVLDELKRLDRIGSDKEELLELVRYIAVILDGLKGDSE